jgi:phosphopantothenoylcysteine decarboxylase / phosphopantothenate---cysteine ligase
MANDFQNRNILLGITGSIAAYKAAELARLLVKAGANLNIVMTAQATKFITPLTFEALIGKKVYCDLFEFNTSAMEHIHLARWADSILIAPASANTISRLAQGSADDLLSTLCLATNAPIYMAPAMNQYMWSNAITQRNVSELQSKGMKFLGPAEGEQACGDEGLGRMLEPQDIFAALNNGIKKTLSNCKVLITAGPTQEAIDPVRYISNHSSGKMGYALAQAFDNAGAQVTLISGPSNITAPHLHRLIRVKSAAEMYKAVIEQVNSCDIFISAAAVADFKVENIQKNKIKKTDRLQLNLIKNPDILAEVAASPSAPITIGFAAETDDLLAHAKLKLQQKNVNMIIANQITEESPFYSDENEVWILRCDQEPLHLPRANKQKLAEQIRDIIVDKIFLQRLSTLPV